MRIAAAGLALSLGLLLGCSPAGDSADSEAAVVEPAAAPLSIPPELLGQWQLTRQECEPDADDPSPAPYLSEVSLTLQDNGEYEMVIEGWMSRGTFTVSDANDAKRVTLEDTLYNFDSIDGTLQNWSEGDAVYVCGNIFTREQ